MAAGEAVWTRSHLGPRSGDERLTTAQLTLFAILCALFGLLAWGRWRYDVAA